MGSEEKPIHNIRRELTKKREEIEKRNAKSAEQNRPANSIEQFQDVKQTRESEWSLFKGLYQGAEELVANVINTPGLTETERDLLTGLQAGWFESVKETKRILNRVAGQIINNKKPWAFIGLAMLSLDLGRFEEAEKYITRAKRYPLETDSLEVFIEMVNLRIAIETGTCEDTAFTALNERLKTCNDNVLKACLYYYLGLIGRFITGISENREKYLLKALKLFKENGQYLYQQALIQLELSYISSKDQGLDDSARLAKQAAELLKKVGRIRESRLAIARYQDLYSQTPMAPLNIDSNSIGVCLFLSREMQRIKHRIHRICYADREPVLILGPRGCGKGMVARAIHEASSRRNGPFIVVNCAAIPPLLLESELFGHERGSFTGADKQKKGRFELADGGTIFLDEIGDMALELQPKLLSVLQDSKFFRVGGETEITVNVRVIAATNRDLDLMVKEKKFREDLEERLDVFKLNIPGLDDRKEEILPFAESFLLKYGDGQTFMLDNSARQYLLTKSYPGNIRVLENDIKRGIAAARQSNTNTITAQMLCDDALPSEDPRFKEIPKFDKAMLAYERDLVLAALKQCNWNKSVTSKLLGLSRRTFSRVLQRHNL